LLRGAIYEWRERRFRGLTVQLFAMLAQQLNDTTCNEAVMQEECQRVAAVVVPGNADEARSDASPQEAAAYVQCVQLQL
jgi:hypothetical protein